MTVWMTSGKDKNEAGGSDSTSLIVIAITLGHARPGDQGEATGGAVCGDWQQSWRAEGEACDL